MTIIALPAPSELTDSAVTEGQFKAAHDTLINFISSLIGSVGGDSGEGYIRVAFGNTANKPSVISGGCLRYNTDNKEIEISNDITLVWDKLIKSTVDGTYHVNIKTAQKGVLRVQSTIADAESVVESLSGSITTGIVAGERYIKCSGTDPLRIWINGVPVMKIDSSGNLTVTGTITQKGTV